MKKTTFHFCRGLVVGKSLGVGGRLLSSLLSAYLDIWPDSHCKKGQSDDFKEGKKASESILRRTETDFSEASTISSELFGKEKKEQWKSERNSEGKDVSCRAPQDGKIQCGRWWLIFLYYTLSSFVVFGLISIEICADAATSWQTLRTFWIVPVLTVFHIWGGFVHLFLLIKGSHQKNG